VDSGNLAAYEVLEKLGEGGMGSVYRAEDRRIGRTVAIKMVRTDRLADEKTRDRFIREARSIGALNHPNIATLYDVALSGETPYIVMEYLPGGSLDARIRRGNPTLGEVLTVAAGIASGLAHAHSQGVIHRDLKPANILFTSDGVPKIIDFGLARAGESTELSQNGVVMGTAEYMSPEQACGKPLDHRSDLFSFGLILYMMASGRHPFKGDSIPATLHSIVYDAPPPMATVRPDFPESFHRIVDGLLDKHPENRPSLTHVLPELHSMQTAGSEPTRTLAVPAAPSRGLRRRWLAPALLLFLAVLAAAGWWTRARWLGPQLPASRQLVVLPFENLSRDPLDQAFCDGLVELLTSSLTQMERFHSSLWVIPSSDVRRLKLQSVGDARKAFPVNLAVTGSLQSDGNQILVVVNLSDAANMRQIGSRIVPVSRAERSQLITRLNSALLSLLDLSGGEPTGGAQPKSASAYDAYVQGKGFLSEIPPNLNRAIELLEQSVKQDPKFAASQAVLADAYLRRYQATKNREWLAKADQMAQRSLELDPAEAQVHLIKGRLYRTTGENLKAVTEYQKAIALDSLNVAAYTNLAIAYSESRRPVDAENAYLQAVRIRPSYWPAYSSLGIFYMNRGEYGKAVEPLSLVVKLAPDYVEGHTNLGTLFYFMNRFDEALDEFSKSLAARPTTTAYSNRGAIYHFKGDYARARDDYRRAIELEGNNAVSWGNLADADSQIPGAEAEARDAYLRAIALSREELAVNPNNANVLGRMAFYLARTSNCAEARSRMKESLRLAPDRVPLIFKAAKVAEACHDRQSAITYLGTAIGKGYPLREVELDPDLQALRQTPAYAAIQRGTAGKK
jgi:tetratricopeptide (TPR) repeat protein/tRNA A-37 threonylcarbamoyl transferase component Bud32/TolB-like protein